MDSHPELIDQLAAFHEDAFGWAAACSGGDADAGADALQEAYVKVATGRAKFAARSSLKTWWFAVVRLTALERRRGQQRSRRIAEVFQEWMAGLNEGTPEPGEELAVKPDASQLQAALAALPARQAEVLHLVFQNDLSLTEAAAVMGVSVGSARQHYARAKSRLRTVLNAAVAGNACNHAA